MILQLLADLLAIGTTLTFIGLMYPEPFGRGIKADQAAMMAGGGCFLLAAAGTLYWLSYRVAGGVVLLFADCLLLGALGGWLAGRHELLQGRLFAAVVTGVLFLGYAGVERRMKAGRVAAEEGRARESDVARIFASAKTRWAPGSGVVEAAAGPFIAWLAVAPEIAVDWEFERERGAAARRRIPITLVLLNDSFKDASLGRADGGGPPLWTLELADPSGAVVRSWKPEDWESWPQFGPAERREKTVVWDGRDASGSLAPPGSYRVRFAADAGGAPGGSLAAETALVIADGGEVVDYRPDPTQESARKLDEIIRNGNSLSNAIRQSDSLRWQMRPLYGSRDGR